MDDTMKKPRYLYRMELACYIVFDINSNAHPETSSSGTQRPHSAPSSPCPNCLSRQGSSQFSLVKLPSRNFSGTTAGVNRSLGSLSASKSFETPYGVVRQTSSSTVEPVRMHSGTSQESFRKGMSVYKLNAMPVLAEDGNSSDEEGEEVGELCQRKKSFPSEKSTKTGKKKGKRALNHHERKQIVGFENNPLGERRFRGFKNVFRVFCSCGRSVDKDKLDSGNLIDITSCPVDNIVLVDRSGQSSRSPP